MGHCRPALPFTHDGNWDELFGFSEAWFSSLDSEINHNYCIDCCDDYMRNRASKVFNPMCSI